MSIDFQRAGIAIVICAPSGTGKTTLTKRLIAKYPRFAFSISCTTRNPREGEVEGKDYYFISKEEFLSRRDAGFFAEWAEVHGNFYGTPLLATEELLAKGHDVLFDIDVQGAKQLRENMQKAHFVFILPPSKAELERRLQERKSETPESLVKRLMAAKGELAEAYWFDFFVINNDLEQAWSELESVYLVARLEQLKNSDFLPNLIKEWE